MLKINPKNRIDTNQLEEQLNKFSQNYSVGGTPIPIHFQGNFEHHIAKNGKQMSKEVGITLPITNNYSESESTKAKKR